jgi:hypothetical protein
LIEIGSIGVYLSIFRISSNLAAYDNSSDSALGLPTNCIPTGKPLDVKPQGIEIAGDDVRVAIYDKYTQSI